MNRRRTRRKSSSLSRGTVTNKAQNARPTFTTPVQLSPKIANVDRVSEILDLIEREDDDAID